MAENLYDKAVERSRNETVDRIQKRLVAEAIAAQHSRGKRRNHSADEYKEYKEQIAKAEELSITESMRVLKDLEERNRHLPLSPAEKKRMAFERFLGGTAPHTPKSKQISNEMFSLRYPSTSAVQLARNMWRTFEGSDDTDYDAIFCKAACESNDLMALITHHIFLWDLNAAEWDRLTRRPGFGKAMALDGDATISDHIFPSENPLPLPYDGVEERAYKLLRAAGYTAESFEKAIEYYFTYGGRIEGLDNLKKDLL